MAMSVDGHRHQREDQPTAIATKASEARGIFGDNDDTCRLLSPKMMALSKTVFLPQVRPLPFDNPENREGGGHHFCQRQPFHSTQRQCFSISLSIGHSHTQPTQTSTVPGRFCNTRKKMPLSLHTRISSALMKGLLASFILVVAADAAHNPALTHEENIKAALGDWERGLSGKPINCRRFVDLFIDDGVWSSPAGARNKLAPDVSSKSTLSLLLASQIGDLCVECH